MLFLCACHNPSLLLKRQSYNSPWKAQWHLITVWARPVMVFCGLICSTQQATNTSRLSLLHPANVCCSCCYAPKPSHSGWWTNVISSSLKMPKERKIFCKPTTVVSFLQPHSSLVSIQVWKCVVLWLKEGMWVMSPELVNTFPLPTPTPSSCSITLGRWHDLTVALLTSSSLRASSIKAVRREESSKSCVVSAGLS